jgi:hypothetical protein
MTIVSIYFKEFFISEVFMVDIVLNVDMFMREHDRRVSMFVAWSLEVVNLDVLVLFVFVY